MSAKNIYNLLATLLGYGLIIAGFIVFGESLENNIKILDIAVCCLVFSQFCMFTLFPLVNLGNPAHKEAGMLGMHLVALSLVSVMALGLVICGIIFDISFKFQLFGQLFVFLILFASRYLILHTGDKVQTKYNDEQNKMAGKVSLKNSMTDFMDDIACVRDLEDAEKERLEAIYESLRFISPSSKPEAQDQEIKFLQSLDELKILVRDATFNKDKITTEISYLERILSRRKQY